MVVAHIAVPFEEIDPLHFWTVDDLVRLPEDWRRYEIVDGQLMMVPSPSVGHQVVANRLKRLIAAPFGDSYIVLEGVALDLAPTFRIPDIMVFNAGAYSAKAVKVLPADVALVVEVVSPGSRTNDRITKPAEYAAAGIRSYWRVELEPTTSLTAYVLRPGDQVYTEIGTWGEGDIALIVDPVAVEVDIADLKNPSSL